MGAYKKLGVNILMFSISSFGTKVINFLLIPLYTSYLTTAQYGTADMLFTISTILFPIFSVEITEGVMRYVLDKTYESQNVLLIAIRTILIGSVVLCISLLIVRVLNIINIPNHYYVFLFLNFLFSCFYNLFINYFKGKEKTHNIVIAGLLSSITNAVCNILFLIRLDMGIEGYLFASILSLGISLIYLIGYSLHYGYLKIRTAKVDKTLERKMLSYSAPLIINSLAWWINNSLDKFFITLICGMGANGILAVAYKIPSLLSMLQTIFSQAWVLSAINEFDSDDKENFIGNVYSILGCALTLGTSVIIFLNIPMARILYANDFFTAWKYTGMLVIANLFGGMSICISGVFSAVKDTKSLAKTTTMGAILNTGLNAILIPKFGIQGAVIATVISNISVWAVRMFKARSYIKLRISIYRDIFSYLLILIQCIVGLLPNHMYFVQLLIIVILIMLYRNDIIRIYHFFVRRLKALKVK